MQHAFSKTFKATIFIDFALEVLNFPVDALCRAVGVMGQSKLLKIPLYRFFIVLAQLKMEEAHLL
jgi:hypothetical protein